MKQWTVRVFKAPDELEEGLNALSQTGYEVFSITPDGVDPVWFIVSAWKASDVQRSNT